MKKDIVVIDDSPQQAEVVTEYLKCNGFPGTRCFMGPVSALEELTDPGPSLVIVDYEMSAMNCIEFLNRLNERFGRTVLGIIVTAISTVPKEVASEYPVLEKGTTDFYPRLLTLVQKWTDIPEP